MKTARPLSLLVFAAIAVLTACRPGSAPGRPPTAAPAPLPLPTGLRLDPAGLALSPEGATLYVAENLGDSLAVVDLASGTVVERHPTERFPYAVTTAADGTVYVSAWGGTTVSVFTPSKIGGSGEKRLHE